MKNSLILENSEITLYSTNNDGTNRLFINNVLIPSSDWVGTGVYTFQNITIHKAESLTGNLMLKKLADFEYFFVNVALKKIYASEVIFDPTESGIPADNVQDAIDKIFLKMHPIGSLYFTAIDLNPGTFLGGTWERWGAGRVVTGYNADDVDFDEGEKVGGSKTRSYTPAGSVGSTSLTYGGTVGSRSLTYGGTVGNHKLTLSEIPSHSHYENDNVWMNSPPTVSGNHYVARSSGGNYMTTNTPGGGSRGNQSTKSSGSDGNHNHPFTGNTASHDHSFTGNTVSHDHSFTGTSATLNCIQPYITCFIWKRTA